jgi:ribosomal protein S18 acetylase RimI-like enzyme
LEYEKYITLPNRRLYGAAENGELAGCIGIECRSPEEMEIRHISVAPDARGKGFGHAMIKAVQEKLQPNVIVAETDREAIGFYRSIGFDIQSLGEKYPGVERFSCRLGKAGS